MSVIYCEPNLFTLNTKIYCVGAHDIETAVEVPTAELAERMPDLCYGYSTNKIHFIGNENYIQGIIETLGINKYTNTNYEIEVN